MTCWRDVVEELFKRSEELLFACPSCSQETACFENLSGSPPTHIKTLDSCCACMLENVLENLHDVERFYSTLESGESVAIYRLGDAIVEITSSSATVVPIHELDEYRDLVRAMGCENADEIESWLQSVSIARDCAEKP